MNPVLLHQKLMGRDLLCKCLFCGNIVNNRIMSITEHTEYYLSLKYCEYLGVLTKYLSCTLDFQDSTLLDSTSKFYPVLHSTLVAKPQYSI